MKRKDAALWERLELVIDATKHSVNSFAKHIGLPRGENLYQIRRGNNGISLDVARRIHENYPEYSISWLLCGEEDAVILTDKAESVVRIPVFRNIWLAESLSGEKASDQLVISTAAANGAQFAIPYVDDILNPYLRDSLVLLREHRDEDILYGNIYLIATAHSRIFRIVHKDENPKFLRLKTLQPSVFNDIQLSRDSILGMWLAVGAVCNMGR